MHAPTHMYTHTHACMHARTHTHTHTHLYTHTHRWTRGCARTLVGSGHGAGVSSPEQEVCTLQLSRHKRVELQRGAQTGANLGERGGGGEGGGRESDLHQMYIQKGEGGGGGGGGEVG